MMSLIKAWNFTKSSNININSKVSFLILSEFLKKRTFVLKKCQFLGLNLIVFDNTNILVMDFFSILGRKKKLTSKISRYFQSLFLPPYITCTFHFCYLCFLYVSQDTIHSRSSSSKLTDPYVSQNSEENETQDQG